MRGTSWNDAGGGFHRQPTALVIADAVADIDELSAAIRDAGGRLLPAVQLAEATTQLAQSAPVDLLAISISGAHHDAIDALIGAVSRFVHSGDAAVVIKLDAKHIDQIYTEFWGPRYTLLCRPDEAELFGSIALAVAGNGALLLNDAGRDSEAVRLQRLNAEVARIADILARLARNGTRTPPRATLIGDVHLGYRGEPSIEGAGVSAADIRQIIRLRRQRDHFFVGGLFEDPAWDMLLDLYAAHLERGRVSVSSLCIAAAVAPTTALRWISRMTDAGLFEREADPFDRRRAFLELSPTARQAMTDYFTVAKGNGVGIPAI